MRKHEVTAGIRDATVFATEAATKDTTVEVAATTTWDDVRGTTEDVSYWATAVAVEAFLGKVHG